MSRALCALALAFIAACATTGTTSPGPQSGPSASAGAAASAANDTWVCHGNKKPKWKKVAAPAVDAHRRHGDRVVHSTQRANTACTK